MNRYKSHKIVEAFQIIAIHPADKGAELIGTDSRTLVSNTYMIKHNPQVDGYYVRYPDGYESWSPATAFEEGYTKEAE